MRTYRKCLACGFQDVSGCGNGSFSFSGTCKCGAKMDIHIGSEPDWFIGDCSVSARPSVSIWSKIKGLFK